MVSSSLYVCHVFEIEYCRAWRSESLELLSPLQVTHLPYVGYFTSPGIDTRKKGPLVFSISSERHRQWEVNEIA